jgi:hypothetical protein
MYYFYVEIEYVATSFSPARMDLAVKLWKHQSTTWPHQSYTLRSSIAFAW